MFQHYALSSYAPILVHFRGKKIGFEKVIQMIDEMIATLKKEQADDDAKKEYCEEQLILCYAMICYTRIYYTILNLYYVIAQYDIL